MSKFNEFNSFATDIANMILGDLKTKEKARDVIMDKLVNAYLDKSGKYDKEMEDYLNYIKNKKVFG